jgi:hypothetical protein
MALACPVLEWDATGNGLMVTDNLNNTFCVSIIPELSSFLLLGLGGMVLGLRRRRPAA